MYAFTLNLMKFLMLGELAAVPELFTAGHTFIWHMPIMLKLVFAEILSRRQSLLAYLTLESLCFQMFENFMSLKVMGISI